jgi:hypothetical protein
MANTREETIERGMPLIKTLQDAGIQASLYARGPAGNDIFMVGKTPGIPGMIMIWPGAEHVEVEAHTDPDLHQAVLVVKEPKRTISQNVQIEIGYVEADPASNAEFIQNLVVMGYDYKGFVKFWVTDKLGRAIEAKEQANGL